MLFNNDKGFFAFQGFWKAKRLKSNPPRASVQVEKIRAIRIT
jgi:hypothetical protein